MCGCKGSGGGTLTQPSDTGRASNTEGPFMVLYSNGFAEEVPDLETARMRTMRPETRPEGAPQDPIATWRPVRVE